MAIQSIKLSSPTFLTTDSTPENADIDLIIQIREQILADPTLSDAEKNLVLQLDLESDITTGDMGSIKQILNKLVTEHQDSPYAYYYHSLYGVALLQENPNQAIKEFDVSISLNPTFSFSYCMRGLTRLIQGDIQTAIQDLVVAAQLGSQTAQELLAQMGIRK
ncbi:MAG: hypothetical protein K1X28_01905 [Parachlamydiales bacterium]|nr:hypothetical protein [Parachlamydiales bacterium]